MINNPTIDKLIEMRLTAMADAYLQQLSDPTMKEADFDDRLGMIIDIEYTRRKNNRLDRLIIVIFITPYLKNNAPHIVCAKCARYYIYGF